MAKAKKKTASKLNAKQKVFCELFATSEDFFGNGVQSYVEAYDIDLTKKGQYSAAGAGACRLLKNTKILAYINKIMSETGFNDAHADKQLSFLMTQNAELGVKLGAIREFNALKARIVKRQSTDITSGGKPLAAPTLVIHKPKGKSD